MVDLAYLRPATLSCRLRRCLISMLAGKMGVAINLTVGNGYIVYAGEHGGIAYGNHFVDRTDAPKNDLVPAKSQVGALQNVNNPANH